MGTFLQHMGAKYLSDIVQWNSSNLTFRFDDKLSVGGLGSSNIRCSIGQGYIKGKSGVYKRQIRGNFSPKICKEKFVLKVIISAFFSHTQPLKTQKFNGFGLLAGIFALFLHLGHLFPKPVVQENLASV